MKPRILASIPILLAVFLAGFVGTSSAQFSVQVGVPHGTPWYQGHPGQWERRGNEYRWQSRYGNEWYQGRPGAWYQERDGWRFRDNDGDEYWNGPQGWQWYDRYGHLHREVNGHRYRVN